MKKFNSFNKDNQVDVIFKDAKKYILKNNITKNPYHNNKHMIDVFNNAMLLFSHYQEKRNLTNEDKVYLGLAALFHDYGHSGGELTDSENIQIALSELRKYLEIANKLDLYDNIEEIIIATEFPHKDIRLSILQKIIRDADTMGGITDGWVDVAKSLAKEYNKSFKEFIPTQIQFLKTIEFNTDYANELLKLNRDKIIKTIKEF